MVVAIVLFVVVVEVAAEQTVIAKIKISKIYIKKKTKGAYCW